MTPLMQVHVAMALFVGSHLLLSHPLRAPIVRAAGERGFAIVYSIAAFATLGWAVSAWRSTPPDRLWDTPLWVGHLAMLVMLFAAILFVGSVTAPNPALMGGKAGDGPKGVQRITRHPMMWAFALWAMVHITVSADSRTIALAGGILILALVGAFLQDGKKRGQNPAYAAHEAATGFIPFGAQLSGRQPWRTASPGLVALIGGVVLFAILIAAHPYVIGVSPILR
jgi:uncharacterized membrane protein